MADGLSFSFSFSLRPSSAYSWLISFRIESTTDWPAETSSEARIKLLARLIPSGSPGEKPSRASPAVLRLEPHHSGLWLHGHMAVFPESVSLPPSLWVCLHVQISFLEGHHDWTGLALIQGESESRPVVSDSLQPHELWGPHGILQARISEWLAFPSSRGSSQPRDQTQVSALQADSFPAEPQRSTVCLHPNLITEAATLFPNKAAF